MKAGAFTPATQPVAAAGERDRLRSMKAGAFTPATPRAGITKQVLFRTAQ